MNSKHKKHKENYTNYSKLYYNEFLIRSDNFLRSYRKKRNYIYRITKVTTDFSSETMQCKPEDRIDSIKVLKEQYHQPRNLHTVKISLKKKKVE